MLNGIAAFINLVLVILLTLTLIREPECIKQKKNAVIQALKSKTTKNMTADPRSDLLGDIVDIEAYPFITSMQKNGRHFCIATIIDKFWAITSSLCVMKYRNGLTLRSGSSIWFKGGIIRNIIQSETFADFGLLRVKQPFPFLPINISHFDSHFIFSIPAYTVAWGIYNDQILNKHLHGEEVYVSQPYECMKTKSLYGSDLLKYEFCASPTENLIDTCVKDLGGPLIQNKVLIGLVVSYESCEKYGYLTLYANTSDSEFRDWYSKVLKM